MASGIKRPPPPLHDGPTAKRARFLSGDGPDAVPCATASSTRSSAPAETESKADTSITSRSTAKRPKVFFCDRDGCTKAFDRPVRLEAHIRTHTNERPFVCREVGCTKCFFKAEHLRAHYQNKHSGEAAFVCAYTLCMGEDGEEVRCTKSFTTATRLRRHEAMHEEREQTKCQHPGCGQVFRRVETLQRHIKKEHLHEDAFRCRHIVHDGGQGSEECGETFATVGKLRAHENREHTWREYICEICSPPIPNGNDDDMKPSSFPTYAQLQLHKKSAHPPTCPSCGQGCPSNRALTAHMEIEHSSLSSRQRFKCEYPGCDRGFTRSGNLKVHFQTVHVKLKPFICGETDLSESKRLEGWDGRGCSMGFGTKASLEGHVSTQHLNRPLGSGRDRDNEADAGGVAADEADDCMELEETPSVAPPAEHKPGSSRLLAMLTGFGYEEQRPIACWSFSCTVRFARNYDLARHMELTHGWNIDDINERLAEKEALEGGQFWIGGADDVKDADGHDQLPIMQSGCEMDSGVELQSTDYTNSLQTFSEIQIKDGNGPRVGYPSQADLSSDRVGVDVLMLDPALANF